MQPPRHYLRRWVPTVVLLLAVAAGVSQQQNLRDWWKLRDYTAPVAVVRLADQTTLTPTARRLFYVNHPMLQDRSDFNTSCSSRGEQTIVLGCYHPVDRGIYVFQVTDERLNGVNQVTAAHEMLHAAYDRMSRTKRADVNRQLQAVYDSGVLDARITSIIDAYKKSEPNDVVNEMHSIFATEVRTLPAELEAYYRTYFNDRSRIVDFADKYQTEFTTRQDKVADYDTQLKVAKQQISDDNADLERQETAITAQRSQLDADRARGDIDSYNAGVPQYNAKIDTYNQLIAATKARIAAYNQLVADRNKLALQVSDLARSIDSNPKSIAE